MGAVLSRIALIAGGLGLGEIGLDSFARGDGVAVVQLGLSIALLVAGSAGFIVPLLASDGRQEVARHV